MQQLNSRHVVKVIGCLCLLGAGCVEGQVRDLVHYDKETDSFHCLEVYSNLITQEKNEKEKKDLDHLQQLWEKRAAIIINPIQDPIQFLFFGSKFAYERKEKHKFIEVSLGNPDHNAPEVRTSKIDLDAITIIPGEFYLNKYKTLSYYQQIVISGKTVDDILEEITPPIAQTVVTEVDKQLQLAAKGTGKRLTWDEIRTNIVAELINKNAAGPKDSNQGKLGPLEPASLRLLIKAATDKSLKLSRSHAVFSLVIPLSERDVREAITTFDFIKEAAVAEANKKGKTGEPGWPEIMATFVLRNREGMGLDVSVNLPKLIMLFDAEKGNSKPADPVAPAYKTMIEGVEARGIKINKTFSLDDLTVKYKGK
jgi:hypothetical protein